ncbi:intradiol ring-cleavage dioxygenase [Trinickia violacea]|uniref:Intradiol ring-cleavage dioxygenase n=1 Tax=Trinickia violacea TaxID=2571746 RepID=A0A4P8ISC6_9BURK|nr:intradiol ring-cleavage dioxygenase [Trinickia violacea]QCP50133.1 intradiol ring-cleavage dioxygenase [Trinickia violacea]
MIFDRHFSRRRFLTTSLALGTALQFPLRSEAAQSQDASLCKLSAEQEIGPYYLQDNLLRSDITEGKAGVPLILDIAIIDKRRCAPLANAIVDIWHCDARGVYSGFAKPSDSPPTMPPGPPPTGWGDPSHGGPTHDGLPPGPPPQSQPTDKLTFLRGIQRADTRGNVTFRTIVPGLYMGRTNHIHFKVRMPDTSLAGEHVAHVGQVFFPEDLMVRLMHTEPYRRNTIPRTTQSEDPVFMHQHGDAAIARTIALHDDAYEKGMRAQVVAVVDPDATPLPVGVGGPPEPRAS